MFWMRCIAFHSFLSKGNPDRKLVSATMHKKVIDVLRCSTSRKTLGEILGEVKISSQIILQTAHFPPDNNVVSKYALLNWSAEGKRSCMRGAPWACGGWGAAQSLQWSWPWEESRAAPRWTAVPPGRGAWTAPPSKVALRGFYFFGKKHNGVAPTPVNLHANWDGGGWKVP